MVLCSWDRTCEAKRSLAPSLLDVRVCGTKVVRNLDFTLVQEQQSASEVTQAIGHPTPETEPACSEHGRVWVSKVGGREGLQGPSDKQVPVKEKQECLLLSR